MSLLITANGLKSQEISTVREIYDYEIGDVFHIEKHYIGNIYSSLTIVNTRILDKYYSKYNDTLFYVKEIKERRRYREQGHDAVHSSNYYVETIFYDKLDSLINKGEVSFVYSDTNYNGRIINEDNGNYGEPYIQKKYVNGCGVAFLIISGHPKSRYIDSYVLTLFYFKKGDEEWGVADYVTTEEIYSTSSDIYLYPNPAKNYVNVVPTTSIRGTVEIYTITGKLVKTFNLDSDIVNIEISELNAGKYIVRVKQGNIPYASRILIKI